MLIHLTLLLVLEKEVYNHVLEPEGMKMGLQEGKMEGWKGKKLQGQND